jgi:hypothetical protein
VQRSLLGRQLIQNTAPAQWRRYTQRHIAATYEHEPCHRRNFS